MMKKALLTGLAFGVIAMLPSTVANAQGDAREYFVLSGKIGKEQGYNPSQCVEGPFIKDLAMDTLLDDARQVDDNVKLVVTTDPDGIWSDYVGTCTTDYVPALQSKLAVDGDTAKAVREQDGPTVDPDALITRDSLERHPATQGKTVEVDCDSDLARLLQEDGYTLKRNDPKLPQCNAMPPALPNTGGGTPGDYATN